MPIEIVGRQREQRMLRAAVAAVERGRQRVVLLGGSPGSGKTALLEFAVDEARRRGLPVVDGRVGRAGDLLLWMPADLLSSGADAARRTGAEPAHVPVSDPISLVAILGEYGRPAVIAIDHVNRLDPATKAVLRDLPDRLQIPAGWLLAGRDGVGENGAYRLFDGLRDAGASYLELGPLPANLAVRLFTLGLGAPPGPSLAVLLDQADGNPLLVGSLIRGVREEQQPSIHDGLVYQGSTKLPRAMRAAAEQIFEDLTPDCRNVVSLAAALTSPFPLMELAAAARMSSVDLLPLVREAVGAGVLRHDDKLLRFENALLREIEGALVPEQLAESTWPEPFWPSAEKPAPYTEDLDESTTDSFPWYRAQHPGSDAGTASSVVVDGVPVASRSRPEWASLTVRERAVAALAAEGMTNSQVAARLFLSPHTVNYHLRQVYRKLEVRSRVQLAREYGGTPTLDA